MKPAVDEVIYSQRKTISIEVQADGKVVMRVPRRTSQARIQQVAAEKAEWIRHTKEKIQARQQARPSIRFEEGANLPLFGRWYPLTLRQQTPTRFGFSAGQGFWLRRDQVGQARKLLVEFYREATRAQTSRLALDFCWRWQLSFGEIRVTSAVTRWGSCSPKNNLSFTYRLALLPLDLVEYIVAHELTHTRHHNHGPEFWKLVARMIPDYQLRRKKLKDLAALLPEI